MLSKISDKILNCSKLKTDIPTVNAYFDSLFKCILYSIKVWNLCCRNAEQAEKILFEAIIYYVCQIEIHVFPYVLRHEITNILQMRK